LVHIPEEEINILKRITGEEVEITVQTSSPEIGEVVEIIKGSLAGMRGKLIKRENKNMVVIDLSNIGYQLNITVDIDSVKKI
jgi:transcription antitermination factor NusG